jgi:hypothetical protein
MKIPVDTVLYLHLSYEDRRYIKVYPQREIDPLLRKHEACEVEFDTNLTDVGGTRNSHTDLPSS